MNKLFFLLLLLIAQPLLAEWETVKVPTTADLRGLSVPAANVIWASGTGGTVIRSVDGGSTWSAMIVPGAEQLDFRGIRAFDESTAIIISSGPAEKGEARIYRTNDGGKNWQQVLEEKRTGIFFDAIAFWDRKHGIVLSDPIDGKFALFTTEDSGTTWKQLPPASLPVALPNEGAFAASNSCLAVQGVSNVWFATGGASVARVFRSSDRGKAWSVADTPVHPANDSSGIFSLAFEDAKNGIAVGGDYAHPHSSTVPHLLFTNDAGKSWTGATTEPRVYLSSVSSFGITGKDNVVAVGTEGALVSQGLGAQWTRESSENLNSVAVIGSQSSTIWAVGPKGVVLRKRIH